MARIPVEDYDPAALVAARAAAAAKRAVSGERVRVVRTRWGGLTAAYTEGRGRKAREPSEACYRHLVSMLARWRRGYGRGATDHDVATALERLAAEVSAAPGLVGPEGEP